jgi:hypothetical protein
MKILYFESTRRNKLNILYANIYFYTKITIKVYYMNIVHDFQMTKKKGTNEVKIDAV